MAKNLFLGKIPIPFLMLGYLLFFTSGCGGDRFPLALAKGKVVCGGKPVTTGSVSFSPISETGSAEVGKPASGAVGPDGVFVLSTHDRFDGAVIGKHRVIYVGPEGEEEQDQSSESAPAEGSPEERKLNAERIRKRQAEQRTRCVQQGELILEVKADGENDFTIELVPAG